MKKQYSIGTKALILYMASLLLTGFVLTALVALLVNYWKKSMLQNAISLAREHGQRVAGEISDIIHKGIEPEMAKLKQNPRVHASIELLLKQNDNIVMAALVDERGTMVIRRYQGEERRTSDTAVIGAGGQYTGSLPSAMDDTHLDVVLHSRGEKMREMDIPVMIGEKMMGKLQFSVSEDAILNRLSDSSSLITQSLVILLVTLLLILSAAYFLLWRIFSRHVLLIRERDQLDKLAAIGTLASGLAHEIRNPLNSMNINIDVVREELDDPREDSQKKAVELLGSLKREIHHLNQTLSNFMKFALPGKIEKHPTDLAVLIRETLEFVSGEITKKNIKVENSILTACPLLADSTSLKQLLLNLILNAVQAMEQQPRKELRIEVFPEGKFWHLTITDNGAGFGKTDPEKCFEVFYTTRQGGFGFGLPIARQIAEAHGGRLNAENAPPAGARFHLIIPR